MKMESFSGADAPKEKPKSLVKKLTAVASLGLALHAFDAGAVNLGKKTIDGGDQKKNEYTMSAEDLKQMSDSKFNEIKKKHLMRETALDTIRMQLKDINENHPNNNSDVFHSQTERERKASEKILANEDTAIEYDMENNEVIFRTTVDGIEAVFHVKILELKEKSESVEK